MNDVTHFYFLPWLNIKDSLQVHNIELCPITLSEFPDSNELDQKTKDTIIKELSRHYDDNEKPREKIVLCKCDGKLFHKIDKTDEVNQAVEILAFLYTTMEFAVRISSPNASGGTPCTNMFEMRHYQIPTDTTKIVTYVAGVNRFWGDVKFYQPLEAVHQELNCDNKFIKLFSEQLYSSDFDSAFRTRIFRGLDLLFYAHIETAQHLDVSKVILLATALEIILEIQEPHNKKIEILEKFEEATDRFFIKEKRTLHIGECNAIKEKGKLNNNLAEFTKIAWWGYDFYKLRNDVVHGEPIKSSDLFIQNGIPHKYIANLVLLEYIISKMPKLSQKCIVNLTDLANLPPATVTSMFLHDAFEKLGWVDYKK